MDEEIKNDAEVDTQEEVEVEDDIQDDKAELDKLKRTIKRMERRIDHLTAKNKRLEEELSATKTSQPQQEEDDKDKEIAALKAQITMDKAKSQASADFQEAGVVVNTELLSLVVTDDEDKTADNVDLIINFVKKIEERTKQNLLSGGPTPKASGAKKLDINPDEMSLAERSELFRTNPSLYQQYFG